ncbi:DMT family transporter [Legionella sp. W05-934-2]|jgi:drug/metabolite transporter (DMT)-like permease|uniref:DMT family transporter n=1 Tax=Legionella sp. W05-934-2 TaxID=1198649 RepID=UPI00346367B9
MRVSKRLTGMLLLLLSAIITSAGNPTIAKLIDVGNQHLINGNNPISFCNVLFASSLVALITLSLLYYRDLKTFKPATLDRTQWSTILFGALLNGFIIPTLFFYGIMYANIINVILISTLQTPFYILAGWIYLKDKPTAMTIFAAFLTTLGVALLVLLPYFLSSQTNDATTTDVLTSNNRISSIPYIGEMFIFVAVLMRAINTVIIFRAIKTMPESVFNVFSMGFGVIFFFIFVMVLFGPSHFIDLFSPFLWQWMLFYGGVVIALYQYIKFWGIKSSSIADVAISKSLVPFSAIFLSFLILGTLPKPSQYIGGLFIFAGIAIALISKLKKNENPISIVPKQGPTGL